MCGRYISIHAPTRGATEYLLIIPGKLPFQSTLPREERRKIKIKKRLVYYISIHAPTRGATILVVTPFLHHMISIHAPTRGATSGTEFTEGFYDISIHAPTRGATYATIYGYNIYIFQSTLPREERLIRIPTHTITFISIHAPTRGATEIR